MQKHMPPLHGDLGSICLRDRFLLFPMSIVRQKLSILAVMHAMLPQHADGQLGVSQ